MDNLTPEQRKKCMSNIRAKDTKAELALRSFLWRRNVRGYRVNYKLVGKPDIYFPSKKIAVFVDGCFWHKCPSCFVKPKSKNDYWDDKIEKNKARDKKTNKTLEGEGIKVIRFWEHEVKKDIDRCFQRFDFTYKMQ
jgi:DNA mismatch endonuclease (patch repair protein)